MFYLFLSFNFILPFLFIILQNKSFRIEFILYSFLFYWINLILTGYITSFFGLLGNIYYYFSLTLIFTSLFLLFIKRNNIYISESKRDLKNRIFIIIIFFCFLCLVASNLYLSYYFLPNNPDSLAYRFTRPFLYVSQGNLYHPSNGIDPRILFYPLGGPLSNVPVALFQLDIHWLHFFTLGAWILVYFSIYFLSISIKSSQLNSHIASLIGVSSGLMYSIATAGNDELMAGVTSLLGFTFFYRWLNYYKNFDYFLFLISIIITVSMKEHYVFLLPGLGLYILNLIIRIRLKDIIILFKKSKLRYQISFLMIVLFTSINSIYNYISSKSFSSDLSKAIINSKLSIIMGLQNFYLFISQLTVASLIDFQFSKDFSIRAENYKIFKENTKFITSWIDLNPDFFSPYDPFKGLFLFPEASFLMETTLWFGFIPLFLIYVFIQFYRFKQWRTNIYPWLIFFFFSWILVFSFIIKFQYTVQTYFTYSFIFAIPAIAKAIDLHIHLLKKQKIFFKLFLILVIITNIYQCIFIFGFSIQRGWGRLRISGFNRLIDINPSDDLSKFMKSVENANILYTHWELYFIPLIALNTKANYFINSYPNLNDTMINLIPVNSNSYYSMIPIKINNKISPGLDFIGTYTTNGAKENVFCYYKIESNLCKGEYIIFYYSYSRDKESDNLSISYDPLGEKEEDKLLYKFTLSNENQSQIFYSGKYKSIIKEKESIKIPKSNDPLFLEISIKNELNNYILYKSIINLSISSEIKI